MCLSRCRDWKTGWMTGKSEFDSSQIEAFFSSPPWQHRLWGPPILPCNGHRNVFPLCIDVERGVKLTDHHHLVLGWRIGRAVHALAATLAFTYTLLWIKVILVRPWRRNTGNAMRLLPRQIRLHVLPEAHIIHIVVCLIRQWPDTRKFASNGEETWRKRIQNWKNVIYCSL